MANRDGTGPVGDGSVEGRGLGICTGINGDRNEGGPRQGLARKKRIRPWAWQRKSIQ